MKEYEKLIIEHYKKQAESEMQAPTSTMPDVIVRKKELELILRLLGAPNRDAGARRVLDIGCGNGNTLEMIARHFDQKGAPRPALELCGLDYTPEMVELANARNIPGATVLQGDARHLPYDDNAFDFVISERCIINIMDWEDQKKALDEVWRVTRPGGQALLIEGFTDGLDNLNKAREELGLEPVPMPFHNLFFDPEAFLEYARDKFDCDLTHANFMSTHYFISRVFHPLVAQKQIRNTRFVDFFSSVLPNYGNYSFVQAWVLSPRK